MEKAIIGRAKQAPHWGVQSRFRMLSVCRSMSVVCQINCVGGITWPTRMLKVFWGRLTSDTRVIHFLYARALDEEKKAEKKAFT